MFFPIYTMRTTIVQEMIWNTGSPYKPTSRPTSQQTNQSASQPVNQSINLSACRQQLVHQWCQWRLHRRRSRTVACCASVHDGDAHNKDWSDCAEQQFRSFKYYYLLIEASGNHQKLIGASLVKNREYMKRILDDHYQKTWGVTVPPSQFSSPKCVLATKSMNACLSSHCFILLLTRWAWEDSMFVQW